MLERYTPYDLVDYYNPVLRYEARQIRWLGKTHSTLPRHGNLEYALLIAFALIVLLFCGVVLINWNYSANAGFVYVLGVIVGLPYSILGLAQLIVTVGNDLYIAVMTVAYWKTRLGTEQWEALRLAPSLDERALVDSFHAAAQLRVWRGLRLETTTRMIIPMLVLTGLLVPVPIPLVGWMLMALFSPLFVAMALLLLVLVVSLLIYVREPLWRMRTNTALAALASIQLKDTNAATIASVGAILSARLGLLFGGWLWFMLLINIGQTLQRNSDIPPEYPILPMAALGMLVAPALIRRYYGMIEQWSLRRAERLIRHAE